MSKEEEYDVSSSSYQFRMAGQRYPGREETKTGNWGIIERIAQGVHVEEQKGVGDEKAKGHLPSERQSTGERAPEQRESENGPVGKETNLQ